MIQRKAEQFVFSDQNEESLFVFGSVWGKCVEKHLSDFTVTIYVSVFGNMWNGLIIRLKMCNDLEWNNFKEKKVYLIKWEKSQLNCAESAVWATDMKGQ